MLNKHKKIIYIIVVINNYLRQYLNSSILFCRFSPVKKFILINATLIIFIFGQPKETIEFQLDHISGSVLNAKNNNPIYGVLVEILSGNNVLKDSVFTNEKGFYKMENIGYVWKPKIRFTSREFQKFVDKIDRDSDNTKINPLNNSISTIINANLTPIPEKYKIPDLKKSSIEKRAETFFIKGNLFYSFNGDPKNIKAERIIIDSKGTFLDDDGNLIIMVNEEYYHPLYCYVPQMGGYENLAYIIKNLFDTPIFEESGFPITLPSNVLEPTIIYGTVLDIDTGQPVFGAEVSLSGNPNRRLTNNDGKFAFQISKSGNFKITVSPPLGSLKSHQGTSIIKVNNGRGGWYQSNQYLTQ